MKRTFLGEFEEIVLLTVASLGSNAYAVSVTQQIEEKTGRQIGFSSVHTTLQRLEEKSYLSSSLGGATAERGGRRKRFFLLTTLGQKVLYEVKQVRDDLWGSLDVSAFQLAKQS